MAQNSNISWTDHTFNPWIGCAKVSPGCANCYAAEQNKLRKWTADGEWGKERRRTSPDNWKQPLRWNQAPSRCPLCGKTGAILKCACEVVAESFRPRVFCASLADWLDDEVPVEWLADLLALIHATPNLDWLLLTKRPENWLRRMRGVEVALNVGENPSEAWARTCDWLILGKPPANVWLGTTVENQDCAERRIPELLKIPAKVRFLSVEPMLGPVNLIDFHPFSMQHPDLLHRCCGILGPELNWVICGGESGPQRRPFEIGWAESLAEQCTAAGVPFFMKQDAALRSGQQGRLPEALWNRKEFPSPTR